MGFHFEKTLYAYTEETQNLNGLNARSHFNMDLDLKAQATQFTHIERV